MSHWGAVDGSRQMGKLVWFHIMETLPGRGQWQEGRGRNRSRARQACGVIGSTGDFESLCRGSNPCEPIPNAKAPGG